MLALLSTPVMFETSTLPVFLRLNVVETVAPRPTPLKLKLVGVSASTPCCPVPLAAIANGLSPASGSLVVMLIVLLSNPGPLGVNVTVNVEEFPGMTVQLEKHMPPIANCEIAGAACATLY